MHLACSGSEKAVAEKQQAAGSCMLLRFGFAIPRISVNLLFIMERRSEMYQKTVVAIGVLIFCFLLGSPAWAHTPLCSCYDNGDGTVTCEGGFSDGSSASGVLMRVEDSGGKALLKGKMNEDSEFTFDKPSGAYKVVFDAGEGHMVEVDGKDIAE